MRTLIARPDLPHSTAKKLAQQTKKIAQAQDQKAEADKIYKSSRGAKWFAPVTSALEKIAGIGQHCVFCSGGEASQVEHFKPKAVFPLEAMTWENFTWACGLCNQYKSSKFQSDHAATFINPLEENVWNYFFLDKFGNLTPKWLIQEDKPHPRAVMTATEMKLDRQAIQERRQARLANLSQHAKDTLRLFQLNDIDKTEVMRRLATWKEEALQPDVADFFLAGPGKEKSPFKELFSAVLEQVKTDRSDGIGA